MYLLYHNGEVVDQFNPIPDYWDDDLSEDEINDYKGDVDVIAKHVSYAKAENIKNYLVRWNLDTEEEVRAYATDEYMQEDWQLIDFMRKLELPFPIDDEWKAIGKTYNMSIKPSSYPDTPTVSQKETSKPWWKFW